MPLLAELPGARRFGTLDDSPFGAQPVAPARPWPRAVLPGLAAGTQPFAARHGLSVAVSDPAHAAFQPRLIEPSPYGQAAVPAVETRDPRDGQDAD
jgi:hypothetical protein